MGDEKVGFKGIFRCNVEDYENWKNEWKCVTESIRSNAAKVGKNLSEIEIVEDGINV